MGGLHARETLRVERVVAKGGGVEHDVAQDGFDSRVSREGRAPSSRRVVVEGGERRRHRGGGGDGGIAGQAFRSRGDRRVGTDRRGAAHLRGAPPPPLGGFQKQRRATAETNKSTSSPPPTRGFRTPRGTHVAMASLASGGGIGSMRTLGGVSPLATVRGAATKYASSDLVVQVFAVFGDEKLGGVLGLGVGRGAKRAAATVGEDAKRRRGSGCTTG